jgi:hypothetical protein
MKKESIILFMWYLAMAGIIMASFAVAIFIIYIIQKLGFNIQP